MHFVVDLGITMHVIFTMLVCIYMHVGSSMQAGIAIKVCTTMHVHISKHVLRV